MASGARTRARKHQAHSPPNPSGGPRITGTVNGAYHGVLNWVLCIKTVCMFLVPNIIKTHPRSQEGRTGRPTTPAGPNYRTQHTAHATPRSDSPYTHSRRLAHSLAPAPSSARAHPRRVQLYTARSATHPRGRPAPLIFYRPVPVTGTGAGTGGSHPRGRFSGHGPCNNVGLVLAES